MKYIITNIGGGQNYTPSLFDKQEEAYKWYHELITQELKDRKFISEGEAVFEDTSRPDLLLSNTPVIDELFDKGYITWTGNGYAIGEEEGENVVEFFEIKENKA